MVTMQVLNDFIRSIPDQVTSICYYAIPVALLSSARARKQLQGRGLNDPATMMLVMFALFIISCGTGHQIDSYFIRAGRCSAYSPLKTVVSWSTAILSVATALGAIPYMALYVRTLYQPIDFERLQRRVKELEDKSDG